MCEEELSSTLKRISGEDLAANLQRDLESFFEQKYGPLTFQFHALVPQENDMARIDLSLNGENKFMRRYVGTAGYVDGHLTMQRVIRLY